MSVLNVYLGTDDRDLWLDEALGTVGALPQRVTIESETCAIVEGFGTRHLTVDRGVAGTQAVPHEIGTTVSLNSPIVLTPPDAVTGSSSAGISLEITGSNGDDNYGGILILHGGVNSPTEVGVPARIDLEGALANDGDGFLYVTTGGSDGVTGQVLASPDGFAVSWQNLVATGTATPVGGGYASPLFADTTAKKLYAWTGADYEQIGAWT